jgi:hypothetical protein
LRSADDDDDDDDDMRIGESGDGGECQEGT